MGEQAQREQHSLRDRKRDKEEIIIKGASWNLLYKMSNFCNTGSYFLLRQTMLDLEETQQLHSVTQKNTQHMLRLKEEQDSGSMVIEI